MSYETVVVGYDGSSDADGAVEVAADQTGPEGTVRAVTAFHPGSTMRLMQHLQQLPEEFRCIYDPHATEKERQRFLRGSVSTRVATHAPMSVLIVHEAART